jgi:hypothetical protein
MTAAYDYHIEGDYHKSYGHLVVQDSSGKTLRSGRIKNDRQSLGGFLERYRENSHAVVEATRNWMVMGRQQASTPCPPSASSGSLARPAAPSDQNGFH